MPQLIITTATRERRQVALKPHDNTLGRGAYNDIVIESPQASRQHAVITVEAAFTTIRDLGSRNGTFVNGDRIESQALADGDIVRIGSHDMVFVAGDQEFSRIEAQRVPTVPGFPPDLDGGRDREDGHEPTMPHPPDNRRGKP
ncbi:FHA domain-containing protein [Variovorax sp. J22R24]|uniref:FHA domain-containing protein n=1 Tax=Variovorax gracilis TaxID=3053502 RepID=UPI0025771F9C|nr:FHA domain-containing protein [Variovorax sp. J22R24]MDM0103330.1 FHA domain-containing protein [Variovorax sp. J22R24]